MMISCQLSSAVALRDEAKRYLNEIEQLIGEHEQLKGEADLILEMTLMVSGFDDYVEEDFEGMSEDATKLFNSVIDYVKFLKHKLNK